MKKIIIICGPTGTGKTRLGIQLARKYNAEIISADSRQVYKLMDIGTGKEWGDGEYPEVKIWGYDLIDPKDDFSVSQFVKFAQSKINDIVERKKLPIIVGGTGFYIKSLIDGVKTLNIPVNKDLRNNLIDKSVIELFEKLATLDSSKAASLNNSDKNNPRRLIRAIEVAIWNIEHGDKKEIEKKEKYNCLWIGLKISDLKKVSDAIYSKIEKRIESGFIDEVENLLKNGVTWKMQSMLSLGYREAEGFFKQGLTYEEFINLWHTNELNYYKRQMTWFNKMTVLNGIRRIEWFDVLNDIDLVKNVENYIDSWDNK